MLHSSMDLSRLMVHVQQVEKNRKKRRVHEVRRPNPSYQTGSREVVAGAFLEYVISPNLRRGIRVQGTLTLKGVQHLKEADSSQRRAIKVMCSILERNIASMSVFTVESAD